MDDSNHTATFHYQSFSTPETGSSYAFCTCDYCLNYHPYKLRKGLSSIKLSQCRNSKSTAINKFKSDDGMILLKARSLSEVNCTGRSTTEAALALEADISKTPKSNSSFGFYDLWQSEKFKANAFEKDNERLELRVRELEAKLEKETQQQVRISLEWRKTVMKLIDENTHLKHTIESLKT
jgi:hypothetical protein